MRYSLIN